MQDNWHLRKELSIGTIISLLVLSTGALVGYLDTKALAADNAEQLAKIEELPDRIARMEEQVSQLREQQTELKEDLEQNAGLARDSQLQQLAALNAIQVAIARLQAQIDNASE